MPRTKKCKICGSEFISYHGKVTCSEVCRQEHVRQQNAEANARRKNKLCGIPQTKECPICGKIFTSVRRKYCGDACYEKAVKIFQKQNSAEYYERNRKEVIERTKKNRKAKKGVT